MRIEAFNRWTITVMAFFASIAATSLAVGQDLGDEWQSLTAAEWKIIFPAPELEKLIERHQLRMNVDSSHNHEVAYWVDATSTYPKAVIHYLKVHAALRGVPSLGATCMRKPGPALTSQIPPPASR